MSVFVCVVRTQPLTANFAISHPKICFGPKRLGSETPNDIQAPFFVCKMIGKLFRDSLAIGAACYLGYLAQSNSLTWQSVADSFYNSIPKELSESRQNLTWESFWVSLGLLIGHLFLCVVLSEVVPGYMHKGCVLFSLQYFN